MSELSVEDRGRVLSGRSTQGQATCPCRAVDPCSYNVHVTKGSASIKPKTERKIRRGVPHICAPALAKSFALARVSYCFVLKAGGTRAALPSAVGIVYEAGHTNVREFSVDAGTCRPAPLEERVGFLQFGKGEATARIKHLPRPENSDARLVQERGQSLQARAVSRTIVGGRRTCEGSGGAAGRWTAPPRARPSIPFRAGSFLPGCQYLL
jgi:hypothetical protein